jgi:hypothetical protein
VEVLPLLPELLLPELPNLYLLQDQPHVEPVCSKSGKIDKVTAIGVAPELVGRVPTEIT